VITPRVTRLVRVADLQAFREAAIALARGGSPDDVRDRLVVVPTRAAASHLVRSLEDTLRPHADACLLPDFITPGEIVSRFAARLRCDRPVLSPAEREVLLGVACRAARAAGFEPPFQVRPGLIAEVLAFYDELRRRQQDIDTFERLALTALEPGAAHDRGAERLVRQTRFLVAAFREFARCSEEAGLDEHSMRRAALSTVAERPIQHVVLMVADTSVDAHGVAPADWDLLARVARLERLDVVVTDRMLAGTLHERLHRLLPGIEEVRFESGEPPAVPVLTVPSSGQSATVARDREEEVADFARRVKHLVRCGEASSLDRVALVVQQPLPYVYVAREVLRSAGIPCQLFDALPLAAEPYAAALDIVFSCVGASFARATTVALLRSPHFHFVLPDGRPLTAADVAALDAALSESGYLGDADALDRLIDSWRSSERVGRPRRALAAAETLQSAVQRLRPLCAAAPISQHLETLAGFLTDYERLPHHDEAWQARHLRARGAVLGTLTALRQAYERFDTTPVAFDEAAALVRRWIDGQTFAPRSGEQGVHVVDAASAAFGRFEHVQLAGLVEGEWPSHPARGIFYSSSILRELGWPAEAMRTEGARAAFADLLRLPTRRVAVSAFVLEADALVSPSPFLDEVAHAGLDAVEESIVDVRIFDYEALAQDPVSLDTRGELARWIAFRGDEDAAGACGQGTTSPPAPAAFSLSALERYQDCPFKFFASDVLCLEEVPIDEETLSPRARGRFVHEVFQRFFEAWDEETGRAPIGPERVDEARRLFVQVAEPLLARLAEGDAALERARLFGSAVSVGIVDTVLALETASPGQVRERWLEHRFDGRFSLGLPGRSIPLKGVADRIDLLDGHRLRVIDYKTGSAPNPRRALQVAIYALCAQELLESRDGRPWQIDNAAYIAFTGKRTLVPVVKDGDAADSLGAPRARLLAAVDGIGRGEFPPRPHDPMMCRYCAYPSVCRKDYVDDD
jgi:inactivated superfamily I helicase/CRISPR/Cas system-associated exonuclease Cas4 (RecB family)